MPDYLSARQRRAKEAQWKGWEHALERLRERHMPDATYEVLETLTILAMLAVDLGGATRTSKVVSVENASSVVVEVDAFEDRKKILMVVNPLTRLPRTVLPCLVC
jgi:hypothetical protein